MDFIIVTRDFQNFARDFALLNLLEKVKSLISCRE